MDNLYLFIIWNKALFAKDKIHRDIEENFEIICDLMVTWSKDNFKRNLEAFYGRKISNTKDKIACIGTGPFNVLIVKDNSPEYGYRETHDGDLYVNTKIFDKKEYYRDLTARSFRIHSSSNAEELKHDLVVLFGLDFVEMIKNKVSNISINKDTRSIYPIESEKELREILEYFGNNVVVKKEDKLYCFAKCRLDIERFVGNKYLTIFGELEGDIPTGFVEGIDEDRIDTFLNKGMDELCSKYDYAIPTKNNSLRISKELDLIDKIKREIKLLVARVKNG